MMSLMDFAAARRRMVDEQLRRRHIRDERVLEAILEIPREEFIPERFRAYSYMDEPAPIGHGQTISQPYMVALMVQELSVSETDRVLEIGGGCGYHAAVLGRLARHVISMELVPELAASARDNLARTGFDVKVEVIEGNGWNGYEPGAPYDCISVAAAAPDIPPRLLEQLRDPGGRMVIPVGPPRDQELRLVRKSAGKINTRIAGYCRFVPLLGPA